MLRACCYQGRIRFPGLKRTKLTECGLLVPKQLCTIYGKQIGSSFGGNICLLAKNTAPSDCFCKTHLQKLSQAHPRDVAIRLLFKRTAALPHQQASHVLLRMGQLSGHGRRQSKWDQFYGSMYNCIRFIKQGGKRACSVSLNTSLMMQQFIWNNL